MIRLQWRTQPKLLTIPALHTHTHRPSQRYLLVKEMLGLMQQGVIHALTLAYPRRKSISNHLPRASHTPSTATTMPTRESPVSVSPKMPQAISAVTAGTV